MLISIILCGKSYCPIMSAEVWLILLSTQEMEILNIKRWKLLFSPPIHLFIPLFVNVLLGAFLWNPDTTLRRPSPVG